MATTPSINLTDEQLAALLEQATQVQDQPAAQGGAPGTPSAPSKIKFQLGNQTLEGTPEEIQTQVNAALQQVATEVQRLQATAARPQPVAQQPAAPAAQSALDKEKYARLFLEDPVAAQEYLDEVRFGMARPTHVIKTAIQDLGAVEQGLAVQQFMGATDYEATPDNFAALQATMQAHGLPWTAPNLALAYKAAKADGLIRGRQADEEAMPQPQVPQFGRPQLVRPPVVPRGGQQSSATVDADMLSRFESLSPDKMRAFLENLPG